MIVEPLELVVATAFDGPDRDGIDADDIATAVAGLDVTVPAPLRDFYAVAGRYDGMMSAHSRFQTPERLRVTDGHLVFCHENQHVMEWGLRLSELTGPNPAVYVQMTDGPDVGRWSLEAKTLSAFLLGVGCWQAALACDESGESELAEADSARLASLLTPVGDPDLREGGPLLGYVDRDHRVVVAHDRRHTTLFVGTPVEDGLEDFEQRSGLDVNYY
ncbi:hypothetical protein [Virgisporangium aurantiacum]|uniref:SMI1/KNR4 family protein n=1 Tax=Virgisporangium aurantiacum TaxID=175570 RepID=A0A8J3ZM58_9ACTN|nr:hypothetical protein [Virgisporangium aurantiacum]GIJ64088.1 hypothetical protein Vau01_116040 [Virgisporangium aurantiacum]